MGSYYDDDPPRRHRSHRQSRRPVYEEEEVIETRSSRPQRQMDLVRRPRDDSTSSVEEVRRDFPPGDGANVYRRTTVRDKYGAPRARSVEHSYNDDRYADSRRSEGGRRSGGRRDDRGRPDASMILMIANSNTTVQVVDVAATSPIPSQRVHLDNVANPSANRRLQLWGLEVQQVPPLPEEIVIGLEVEAVVAPHARDQGPAPAMDRRKSNKPSRQPWPQEQ